MLGSVMLSTGDIEDTLKDLEKQFLEDQRVREQRYQRERQVLLDARQIARSLRGRPASRIDEGLHDSPASSNQHVVESTRQSNRKARDIVREIVKNASEEFTVRGLIEAASRHKDEEVRSLTEGTFHATIHWFKQHGLVETVRERQSKTEGAVYRIVSPNLKRDESITKRNAEFPLMDLVIEAVEVLELKHFGRKEVTEKLMETHPELAERIRIDSVGATLVKLSSPEHSKIRCVENSTRGNIYEKL